MRRFGFAILMLSGASCYTYQPVGDTVPASGVEVRAHLSPARDFDIGEITVEEVNRIEGTVYSASSDSLALWGQWLYSRFGTRYDPKGAVFYMDRGKVPMMERRTLHPMRTVVALAVIVGIGYGMFDFLADPGGDNTQGQVTPPIEFHLIPNK